MSARIDAARLFVRARSGKARPDVAEFGLGAESIGVNFTVAATYGGGYGGLLSLYGNHDPLEEALASGRSFIDGQQLPFESGSDFYAFTTHAMAEQGQGSMPDFVPGDSARFGRFGGAFPPTGELAARSWARVGSLAPVFRFRGLAPGR